jgi:hypothetical protein
MRFGAGSRLVSTEDGAQAFGVVQATGFQWIANGESRLDFQYAPPKHFPGLLSAKGTRDNCDNGDTRRNPVTTS